MASPPLHCRRLSRLQVQSALSRQRKEETVAQLEELLQKSAVVVGLRYQGLTVKQIQEFRRSLPADSKMLVCKNTLMRVAVDKVEGWDELKLATKGDNAWLFVNEEVGAGVQGRWVLHPHSGWCCRACLHAEPLWVLSVSGAAGRRAPWPGLVGEGSGKLGGHAWSWAVSGSAWQTLREFCCLLWVLGSSCR